MTEEEFFISNYPDSCYGDKPLSPHWDYFEAGVEFGEQKSEKKIEELEKEIERITVAYNNCVRDNYYKTSELEKENAELNETLGKCAKTPVLYCLGAKETINKAKDIIKNLMVYIPVDLKEYEEAEQFLKDNEVEK